MAFQNKKTTSNQTSTPIHFPVDLPPLGNDPAEWKRQLDQWWFDTRTVLQRAFQAGSQSSLSSEFSDFKEETRTTVNGLVDQLKVLNEAITALQKRITPPNSSEGFSELKSAFDAHVQSAQAHGTQSTVVGTSDVQDLDYKDIGRNGPGYGRFNALLSSNSIGEDQTIIIPAGFNMVACGEFYVNGILQIEGTFCVL